MKRILLTGASGRIGSTFFEHTKDKYGFLLTDRREPNFDVELPHEFHRAELDDVESLKRVISVCDTVVHLGGIPDPDASYEEVLANNMMPTKLLLDLAADAECRRFVFASSAQTIERYPVDFQVQPSAEVSPANFYGVSKCFGEALGAYYARKRGLSFIALRIGAFEFPNAHNLANARDLSAFLSPHDAAHLLTCSVEAENIDYFIAYGISNNRFKRFDLTNTRDRLGYQPQDDAFKLFNVPLDPK